MGCLRVIMSLRSLMYVVIAVLALTGCASVRKKLPVSPGVPTVWNFDDPQNPLAAATGPAVLTYRDPANTGWGPRLTKFAKASALGLPPVGGGDAYVMEFPATDKNQGYTITHNSLPNGVFAWDGYVSNYTLIMDVLWPLESSVKYRSLYQTDAENADDAEMFAQNKLGGGIGVGASYNGSLTPGAWHRVAIAVQCALGPGGTGQIHRFIDGQFVGGWYTPGTSARCRWALGPAFHLFADNDGETAKGYVSSIMFMDRFMFMSEIKALGGPNAAGANIPGPGPTAVPKLAKRHIGIIAHRANSGHSPENSLSGIKQAFDEGADQIEVDVRATSDGELVLMHDETVDRTTDGLGPVSSMSLSTLKKLDAGSWFSPVYAGEQVPTLIEALKAAKGRGKLLLDVKSVNIGSAIKQALAEAGVTSDAIWLSQNKSDEAAADFKKYLPNAGILWGDLPNSLSKEAFDALKKNGVVGFDIEFPFVTRDFIDAAHRNGMFVSVFTIMDPDTMLQMIDLGVDAMETDFPSVLHGIMPRE